MAEKTTVRRNLMDNKSYTPYCGAPHCIGHWPRTVRTEELQFKCPACGWKSEIENEFLIRYRKKWEL